MTNYNIPNTMNPKFQNFSQIPHLYKRQDTTIMILGIYPMKTFFSYSTDQCFSALSITQSEEYESLLLS